MASDRNRISITLTDHERDEIDAVSGVLGIKATRVVYECVKFGLTAVLDAGLKKNQQIALAQHVSKQIDWTAEQLRPKKSDKPRTNTQRKQDKKKSR